MRKPSFASLLVWINGAVPATLLLYDAFNGGLGANPVKFAILTTGLLALIFLTLSLAITPLRLLTKWNAPFPARRTLGLWAAIYAFAHFGIFFWWDREHSVSSTVHEILRRDYLWYGTAALVIFIPLTLTSTRGMIRRLGSGWKWLHRLVYLAAIGAAIHYMKQGKVVTTQSIVFASIIGLLLLYRVVDHYLMLRRAAARLRAMPASSPAVAARPKYWTGELKVAQVFRETPDVRTFRLVPTMGTRLPFDYLPGQYLNIMLSVDGKRVSRSYTIASSPTRSAYCELTVKREDMGVSSRHLHDMIRQGDTLHIGAPAGKFIFDGSDADAVVLIGGGVGITPLMSKIRYLTDVAWPGGIYLVFSAKSEADIIFREELSLLAARHPNLHLTVTLTRAEPTAWQGERGRVTLELLDRVVPNLRSRRIHICGPTEMTDRTRAMLIQAGVPESNVRVESFVRAAGDGGMTIVDEVPASEGDGMPAEVSFARSRKTATAAPEQPLLEVAESAGVFIDFDCRSGICGQCRTKLLEGRVTMAVQDALTADDRAAGIVLACQARCVGPVRLDA